MSSSWQLSARFLARVGPNRHAEVLTRPGYLGPPLLGRRERQLVREEAPGGGRIVATNHALYLRDGGAPAHRWQRISWLDIRSVGCSGQRHQKSVMTVRLRTAPGNLILAVRVGRRSRIPDLVSQLAAAAMIASRRVVMTNGSGVTFLALRDPETATVSWRMQFECDADRNDPAVQAEAATVLREIRTQMGC